MTISPKRPIAPSGLSLTRRQLAELDVFLSFESATSGLLTLPALHGFLTAIALLPGKVLISDWMDHVWGGETRPSSESQSSQHAARIQSYICRMYDDIVNVLADPDCRYVPLTRAPTCEQPATLAEEWSRGFLKGMAVLNSHWRYFLSSHIGRRLLLPIFLLGADSVPAKWRSLVSSAEKRAGLASCIPAIVEAMGDELLILELMSAIQGNSGASGDKVEERCACGSGRAYRICCGLRKTVH